MMFGAWGNPDIDSCAEIVDIYFNTPGPHVFDTADMYDRGTSETFLGKILHERLVSHSRDSYVIATKVGNPFDDDPQHRGLSRRWITESCDNSLRRLRVDIIDLYQMHRPDPLTPLLESVTAMHDLVEAGKIRAWGTSTFPLQLLNEIITVCRDNNLTPPVTEQPPYSILCRGIENTQTGISQFAIENNISLIVWAPLNGGWLTGKYTSETSPAVDPDDSSRAKRESDHFDFNDQNMRQSKTDLVRRLTTLASEHGMTMTEMALRFTISHPAVATALIGPRTPEQTRDLCSVAATPLSSDMLASIDHIVTPGVTVNPRDNG